MYYIGSIILIKNLIFSDNDKNKRLDHAKYRPCVVIAEDENDVYFLPISSHFRKEKDYEFYQIPQLYIDNGVKEYINYDKIYSKKICAYMVKDDLDDDTLYDLLVSFYNYHICNTNNEKFIKIKDIIKNEIDNFDSVRPKYNLMRH